MSKGYHNPVMLCECIESLAIKNDGIYVDVTYGGGGHSKAILDRLGKKGRLIAFDQDKDAFQNMMNDNRLTLIHSNFRNLKQELNNIGVSHINGLLADLGVSSHQFDEPSRGFSFRFDEALDMRMDASKGLSASKWISKTSESDMQQVFSQYGEIRNAKTAARNIAAYREEFSISTSGDLLKALGKCVPPKKEKQYLAQLFQSIRIAVNQEIESLKELLLSLGQLIKSEGRFVVLTYHSLEDRLVKHFLQSGNTEGTISKDLYGNTIGLEFMPLYRKAIGPTEQEIAMNPRARSAKLRAGIRI
ncbi:MAG TPA: 16S rRNA (cytosine(1402)-N(4))-methyltransferase RsmH [Bacteroidia bacterium]|nr:16S rRNA (cytosine(1402)-N(4))-methyltransferase RsmH [Bacteroidia bacterium]